MISKFYNRLQEGWTKMVERGGCLDKRGERTAKERE